MKLTRPHLWLMQTRRLQVAVLGIALAHATAANAFVDFAADASLASIDVARVPGSARSGEHAQASKAVVPTRGETLASVFAPPKEKAPKTTLSTADVVQEKAPVVLQSTPVTPAPSVASAPSVNQTPSVAQTPAVTQTPAVEQKPSVILSEAKDLEAKISAAKAHALQVTITLDGTNATFDPPAISFDDVGATADVVIRGADGSQPQGMEGLNLFVRDQNALSWNPQKKTLVAGQEGQTEIYLVWQGKMVIVPVAVKKATAKIDVPESLVSLGNLFDKSASSPHASFADGAASKKAALSVRASSEEAQDTMRRQEAASRRYGHIAEEPRFRTLVMQVIDERSIPEGGVIYPVHDAQVRISGTDFYAASDATGLVNISDVPVGGRILAQVYDRDGRYQPTVQEIFVEPDENQEVVRVKLLQRSMFDVYARTHQLAQDGRLASVCGRAIVDQNGVRPLEGVRVALNVDADGPYYFNRYGPDPYARETDDFGRFCFFNVRPGLTELAVYQNNALTAAVTIPLFGGRHLEDDFVFETAPPWATRLAVAAPALDQLFEANERADRYEPQDAADLTLIGENVLLEPQEPGLMSTSEGASAYRERAYALSQGAEFEPALYAYDMGEENIVTPLFPRGFVEDLFRELYLQDNQSSVAFDPSLGSVVVHTGLRNGMSAEDVTIKLLDGYGREIEGGWYFGGDARDVVKAVFFNVPPGVYTVLAETKNRHWLDVTTVAVDYWTLSYARLGTKLRYSQ